MSAHISGVEFSRNFSNDPHGEGCSIQTAPLTRKAQNDSQDSPRAGTEPALIRAAKAGDELAFLELYKRCLPVVSRTAFRILQNRADVDDVVQECMLKAYSRLHQFDERAAFSTWVVRIGINDALTVIRKRNRSRTKSLDECVDDSGVRNIPEIRDAAPDPEECYGQSERMIRLREAVGKLPRAVRDVMELRQNNDASVREISESLNLSVAAVKSRLHRGRKALHKIMHAPTGSHAVGYKAVIVTSAKGRSNEQQRRGDAFVAPFARLV